MCHAVVLFFRTVAPDDFVRCCQLANFFDPIQQFLVICHRRHIGDPLLKMKENVNKTKIWRIFSGPQSGSSKSNI
ncbi:hypothetical protein BGP_5536 [Beggiatoa sp. PS]|nr:hypothetical protein BGP_5536 [Beggiatoa sp. PS]